jgi:hypothetical protein
MHTTTKRSGSPDAAAALDALAPFIGRSQRHCVASFLTGEDGPFFAGRLVALAAVVAAMPTTYGQEGRGNQTVAHLHYFTGGADWYITEKDINTDGAGQLQAFGLADMGHGPEMGYISIPDLLAAGAELDFHFTPTTLADLATHI